MLVNLLKMGFSVVIKDNKLKLFDTKEKLALASPFSKNRTFRTNKEFVEVEFFYASSADSKSFLWHQRYCHQNFRSLYLLNAKVVNGMPKTVLPG